MIVVSDTSPLNYLVLIDAVGVLQSLYETVFVPEMVIEELRRPKARSTVSVWAGKLPDWIVVRALSGPLHKAVVSLDPGEAAAATLAVQLGITNLLVDDLEARAIARERLHLHVVGTLGILLTADSAGLLAAEESFERLKTETTFRASADLEADFYTSLRARRKMRTP